MAVDTIVVTSPIKGPIPSVFPGNVEERKYPKPVCTAASREWAIFIASLLNEEYRAECEEP